MRRKDIPAGAAITIVALVLLASAVTGREDSGAPGAVAEPAAPPARATSRDERPVSADDLDLARLKRPKSEGEVQDLFASRAWTSPAPAAAADAAPAKPIPPPAPTAPPLPFKYLGRMADSDRLIVFLEKNQETLSAVVGDTIDNTYRVESISESAVQFVYLPLGSKQVLNIPAQY